MQRKEWKHIVGYMPNVKVLGDRPLGRPRGSVQETDASLLAKLQPLTMPSNYISARLGVHMRTLTMCKARAMKRADINLKRIHIYRRLQHSRLGIAAFKRQQGACTLWLELDFRWLQEGRQRGRRRVK